ncbi:MAG: 50S ribosome-binding GTPase [Phycisphaeraceae bacterium]|nr:50S ribosome-binding GTPase [Phycisphaeraceae bacterium]
MSPKINTQPPIHSRNCSGCTACDPNTLTMQRLGIKLDGCDYVIALAGNPNTGKTTVFNTLTGLRQHTGNWPGKTVARAEGAFACQGKRYKLVDLPGTYSLLSASVDEEVARDFVLFGKPDCTVVVTDATALERNLNLTYQVMEITTKVVVCVNLIDEAKRKGIDVDIASLQKQLGAPVVATAARPNQGIDQLVQAVAGVVDGTLSCNPKLPPTPKKMQAIVERMLPMIKQMVPGLPSARWVAYRLIEGDHRIRQALLTGELAALYPISLPVTWAASAQEPKHV